METERRNVILGISAFYHDAAAALIIDGMIVAAAHEERFTRKKNDDSFPSHAIRWMLSEYDLTPSQLDAIVFYDKPILKFERLLETYHRYAPSGIVSFSRSMPIWLKEKLFTRRNIIEELEKIEGKKFVRNPKLLFPEHHLSHAASAFYPSPFEEAAILTVDGVGEWATTTIGRGKGKDIEILREMRFPHSLGILYSAFTYYCGFKINDGEYKLMGLAPYGRKGSARVEKYKSLILEHLVDLKNDGSFFLDMSYFTFATTLRTVDDEKWQALFGIPARAAEGELTEEYMDLALAIQEVTEGIMLALTRTARELTGSKNLVLAGGVALNCVSNAKIRDAGIFEHIWVQPAAGDAGGALGAALLANHIYFGKERLVNKNMFDSMQGSYLGPEYSNSDILKVLRKYDAKFHEITGMEEVYQRTADLLAKGNIVGWMQGKTEWGPRALGNRSILADARSAIMQKKLNLQIKYREGFRPFAPAVLEEDAKEYFDIKTPSPYMLFTAPVKKERRLPGRNDGTIMQRLNTPRSDIPAVTHLDYSARLQTVSRYTNERFWNLLNAFKKDTGFGLLVNTSFNVRDEPIVQTPEDAYRCFMKTEMDALVIGNILLLKKEQFKVAHAVGDNMIPSPILPYLKIPAGSGGGALSREKGEFTAGGRRLKDVDSVPSLLFGIESDEHDPVTGKIKAFYEENPFPNYEGKQNFGDLVVQGEKNPFMRGLLDSIGFNKTILECGCGTGQWSHFLSLGNNFVLGIDLSISSLSLAVDHKKRNDVDRVGFVQMNIFDLGIKDESFDVILSSGVLHHTKDAKAAFESILKKAKPGGLVVIGLYNNYARIPTWIRSKLLRLFGTKIDYIVRKRFKDSRKLDTWIKDQYFNPHETWHSLGEVQNWFKENNVTYLNSFPAIIGTDGSKTGGELFNETSRGNSFTRALTQISWLGSISREGALFIVTGRREG